MAVTVKQGDLFPDVETTVRDENDAVVDVTGATVVFSLRPARAPATDTIAQATAIVVDGPNGQIAYRWQSGDTDLAAGTYEGEFLLTPAVGDPFRCPTSGYIPVYIEETVA